MSKLWAFGCSITAGHELGTGLSKEHVKMWYEKNTNGDNWWDAWRGMEPHQVERLVVEKWNNRLRDPHDPHLAYAGIMARELGLELECRAKSGSGLDRVFTTFYNAQSEIDYKNDVVVFQIPPPMRYMDIMDNDRQVALFHGKTEEMLAPSEFTLSLLTRSVITMLHHDYNVQIIGGIFWPKSEWLTIPEYFLNGSLNFRDLEIEMFGQENRFRYPMGHYHEDLHEEFGKRMAANYRKIRNV